MSEKPEIKIGDTYYIFDVNRRVYERDESGRAIGGATHRGHYAPVKIEAETSRSWIIGYYGKKVPKADPWSILYTDQMVDDAVWVNEHVYRIAEEVRRIRDVLKLKEVAALIGYEGLKP